MATKVVVAARPVKTSEMIDKAGNIIDRQTKEIIQVKEPDYVSPVAVQPVTTVEPQTTILTQTIAPTINQVDPLSIQAQIDAVKENLKKLEELKRLKIQEMKETIKFLKKK